MCCEDLENDLLTTTEAAEVARYQRLLADRGFDWGREYDTALRLVLQLSSLCEPEAGRTLTRRMLREQVKTSDPGFVPVLLAAMPDPLPAKLAIVDDSGIRTRDPLPLVSTGRPLRYLVLDLTRANGNPLIRELMVSAENPCLTISGSSVRLADISVPGRLRLNAEADSRWTVTDERGGECFPDGSIRKFDYHRRPYFHGNRHILDVPAGRLSVCVARGCEFRPLELEVEVGPDDETVLDVSLTRLFDAADRGWYGGDLHVHQNYSGDSVCTAQDAAAMQVGEALHVMNLLAANANGSLVYDQAAFEGSLDNDLPWTDGARLARRGIEYRNDLLGHFHVFNMGSVPKHYHTGHVNSDAPLDWPPNAATASECRAAGAAVGYTHPVLGSMPGDDPGAVFSEDRLHLPEARELIVDAALGLVDSVDLAGPQDLRWTEALYHHLLGCGLRLAASAGSDVMLSHTRGPLRSNPPGWCRVYAQLGDTPLSAQTWQEALSAGRTFATNGPWLELTVSGAGPGSVLSCRPNEQLEVSARFVGLGVDRLELMWSDGLLAARDLTDGVEEGDVTVTIPTAQPQWIAAIARGGSHPATLGPQVYAHTSPVWIEIDGRAVAQAKDAAWCLDWLRHFEQCVRQHGKFSKADQLQDLLELVDQARQFYRQVSVT